MSDHSPEQFLSPKGLNDLLKPAQIPEGAAQALGGIGLGDVQPTALPAGNQNKSSDGKNVLSPISPELQETAESIRGQLVTSLKAYDQFTAAGDLPKENITVAEKQLEETIQEWANNGDLEYIRQQQEADPDLTFDLVINNGETLDCGTLFKVADSFAADQDDWNDAYISKDFLEQYTDEELSGPQETRLSFILIPNTYTIQPADVEQQVQQFEQLQRQNPSANLIIPSMKDAVAWWYTKRQQQREASGNPSKQFDTSNFNDTFIRHINLTPKGVGSVSALPESYVYDDGRTYLSFNVVEDAEGVRVAVG